MGLTAISTRWSGKRPRRWTTALVLAGAVALPLENAATIDVGFTVRLSDVLFGLALVVGLPFVLRGLVLLPSWPRWTSLGLFALYVLVTATSHLATDEGTTRGGAVRALVYLGNLAMGIGVMCLVVGLWRGLRAMRPLLVAVTCGATLAALYAIWQWPAQRFGLPLSDILTTHDSNGITTGTSQGVGILGWERVRGTFLEPHFLAAFMAASAPLAVLVAAQFRGWARQAALAAAALMVLALVLTASAPGWASFAIAAVVTGTAYAIGLGRPRLAAAAACCAALAVFFGPAALLVAPQTLASATGRDSTELTVTAGFRRQTWTRVLDIWATRPAQGHGAGQSSVRLTLSSSVGPTPGLQSAQGLWAASLIDVGILGLGLWLALLGSVLVIVLRRLTLRPSLVNAALAMATVAALSGAFVTNDRLGLSIWLLLGIVIAAGRGSVADATG